MQSLLSQLHGMSAGSKGLAAPPTNDPDSASIINEIHRNQHETQQVLQNMVQAISKVSVSDTVDPLLEQRTQSESSVYDVATSMKPLNASIDQSAEIEKLNSLPMAVMRPGKTMRSLFSITHRVKAYGDVPACKQTLLELLAGPQLSIRSSSMMRR